MLLFAIRNGQLVPTNSDFEDFYDVRNTLGHVDAGKPGMGDIAVVVADGSQPLRRVPRDAVTITTVDDDPSQDVFLFWAVNEDDGNKEVIVAFDNYDVANDSNDLWRIIGFDEWVQLPLNKELIRAFRDVDEARACVHADGTVFVPIVKYGEWRGVMIHGPNAPSTCKEINTAKDDRVVRMFQIPSGWDVSSATINGKGDCRWLYQVLCEPEVDQLPKELREFTIVRVIITAAGGATVVASFPDGQSGGIAIVAKTFTHEEAKTALTL